MSAASSLLSERLERFKDIDVYPVTCEELSNSRSDEDILKGVIDGGAKIVQLRDKRIPELDLFRKAEQFRKITKANNVLLIINDHVDIAASVDADGVHLGQDDLPILAARKLLPNAIIGISTHAIDEAMKQAALRREEKV